MLFSSAKFTCAMLADDPAIIRDSAGADAYKWRVRDCNRQLSCKGEWRGKVKLQLHTNLWWIAAKAKIIGIPYD